VPRDCGFRAIAPWSITAWCLAGHDFFSRASSRLDCRVAVLAHDRYHVDHSTIEARRPTAASRSEAPDGFRWALVGHSRQLNPGIVNFLRWQSLNLTARHGRIVVTMWWPRNPKRWCNRVRDFFWRGSNTVRVRCNDARHWLLNHLNITEDTGKIFLKTISKQFSRTALYTAWWSSLVVWNKNLSFVSINNFRVPSSGT